LWAAYTHRKKGHHDPSHVTHKFFAVQPDFFIQNIMKVKEKAYLWVYYPFFVDKMQNKCVKCPHNLKWKN
jgi:hypothetical protein